MVGNTITSLFGQRNDGPLGAALSVMVMLIVTAIVCLFLWSVGYRKMQRRGA
jgi:spermidine/putrescine transport system permease protein